MTRFFFIVINGILYFHRRSNIENTLHVLKFQLSSQIYTHSDRRLDQLASAGRPVGTIRYPAVGGPGIRPKNGGVGGPGDGSSHGLVESEPTFIKQNLKTKKKQK